MPERRLERTRKSYTACAVCDDAGWICEEHPDRPWGIGDSCCGGAGMPCPQCNPLSRDNIAFPAADATGEP